MLKQRVITGLILGLLALIIMFALPQFYFMLATGAIITIAIWEWSLISGMKIVMTRAIYTMVLVLMMIVSWHYLTPSHAWVLHHWYAIPQIYLLANLILWLVAIFWVKQYPRVNRCETNHVIRAFLGLLLLIPSWFSFVVIRFSDSVWLMLYLILLITLADSGAYFCGRQWGKNKLAPNVSPGKTRQGLYGALLATLIFAIAASFYFQTGILLQIVFVVVSMLTVLAALLGDLFESMYKRIAGVKDSGNILPGHGGILDRIDSLTAAGPVFAIGIMLLNSIK